MGYWRTEIAETPEKDWYLRMVEYDYEGFVTDVDEPWLSRGLIFERFEDAKNFCDKNEIRVEKEPVLWDEEGEFK